MITLVTAVLLCSIYLVFVWNRYNKISGEEAIILANSLESMIHSEHVASLKGDGTDIDNPDYVTTKKSLMKLAETENKVNFAYLMAEKYGEMVFLVDSEKSDSPDYSPPGEVYKEADSQVWYPLTIGKTVLTRPTPDRWGNWISVLVPVRDPDNNEVIALFGIDYDAAEWYADIWKRMVPDIFVTTSVILLVVALLRSRDHYRLERMLKEYVALRNIREESDETYHLVVEYLNTCIEMTGNKLTALEMLMANEECTIILFEKVETEPENLIKLQYDHLGELEFTRDKLNTEEKLRLAFAFFGPKFIVGFDQKSGKPIPQLNNYISLDRMETMYQNYLFNRPEMFDFKK